MKYQGELTLLTVAIIWGSGFVASDLAVGSFTAFQVLGLRFALSAILLALLSIPHLKRMDRRTLLYGVVLGIILYVAFLFQTVGLVYTTPSKNAFLTSVNVIIVPFIGWLLYKRPIDRYGTVGAFLAIIGVGLISFNLDLSVNVGDLLTLLCALSFAFHIFYTGDFLNRGAEPVALTVMQLSTAGVLGGVVALITTGLQVGDVKGGTSLLTSFLAVIYLAIFSTTLAFLMQTLGQKYANATRAAVILATESVFGTLFAAWLLKDHLTTRAIVGSVLVFAAILIAEVKPGLKVRLSMAAEPEAEPEGE